MFCQQCRTPLGLDSSLENLDSANLGFIRESSPTSASKAEDEAVGERRPTYPRERRKLYQDAVGGAKSPVLRRSVGSSTQNAVVSPLSGVSRENPAMSFVVLTESQVMPPANERADSSSQNGGDGERHLLSQKMETATRLFEVLSSRTDIDHPICTECTDLLLEKMEKRLATATREKDAYLAWLRSSNADLPTSDEQIRLEREVQGLQDDAATAMAELEKLEADKASLEAELATLEAEARAQDDEEDAFWRERNEFYAEYAALQDERDSLTLRYEHDARQLAWLQRTNVYNDTFPISHDGQFATINALRLGRLASHPVEWAEINAAWGQACLLLQTVSERLAVTLQGYRLKPMGSTSTIDRIDTATAGSSSSTSSSSSTLKAAPPTTTTSLPLHYTSDLPLSLNFLHRHFDAAMIAFLDCVRQLGRHVERATAAAASDGVGLQMPYEIVKDRINDCSIKLGGGFGAADESWTKACKFTLTCCKFLLAHASNADGARRAGAG